MSDGHSTAVRLDLARRNEEQVLAESTLEGERRASVVRLSVLAITFLSQRAPSWFGEPRLGGLGLERGITVALYVALSLGLFFGLRRSKPGPRRALWMPFLVMAQDFGFVAVMSHFTLVRDGDLFPERTATFLLFAMAFSMFRHRRLHTVVAVVTASAIWIWLATQAGLPAFRQLFVVGMYGVIGALMWITRDRIARMFVDLRKRERLGRFLAPQVVNRLMAEGDAAIAPTQREVTVLFSDIRDFTRMSEHLPPKAVLEFLDDFFGRAAQVVAGHEGMVNKFLGDGMLAVWGVPEHNAQHARCAVRCALDLRRMVEELNAQRATTGQPPVRIGIGIHSGTVAAGMLGGPAQHEYTVIGDAVNLASRVEGLTKELGVDLLLSDATAEQLGAGFALTRLGERSVKGRVQPVAVYTAALA